MENASAPAGLRALSVRSLIAETLLANAGSGEHEAAAAIEAALVRVGRLEHLGPARERYHLVSSCPRCGAPIYETYKAPLSFRDAQRTDHHVVLFVVPDVHFTCDCRLVVKPTPSTEAV